MLEYKRLMGKAPGLFKLDIDAAFRRMPIRGEDRWVCVITFRVGDKVVEPYR